MAFAVVDFETTGILPTYHHRVVEIGVTQIDDDGSITRRWETLVNPQRDLGPQQVHGIRAADILDAPTFHDIAGEFAGLLQGRVFAAHNASFDLRFLRAEFDRAGYPLMEGLPSICTMTLGKSFGLGAMCSLFHACESYGIDQMHAHSAGDDSFATAQLLTAFRSASHDWPGWSEYWSNTAEAGRHYVYPTTPPSGVARKARPETAIEPESFLERIAHTAVHEEVDGASAQYWALLDRCLLDRYISVAEGAQLADVAAELGLTRSAIDVIHRDYFLELERRAWADDVLTPQEKDDLRAVGALLYLDAELIAGAVDDVRPQEAEAATPSAFVLTRGDLVVLTGEMTRARSEWENDLRARGLVPHPAVTKKVALVVAADPDSLSGKARTARNYGIPIVNEDGLKSLLDGLVHRNE